MAFFTCIVAFLFAFSVFFYLRCGFFICVVAFLFVLWFFICVVVFLFALWVFFFFALPLWATVDIRLLFDIRYMASVCCRLNVLEF